MEAILGLVVIFGWIVSGLYAAYRSIKNTHANPVAKLFLALFIIPFSVLLGPLSLVFALFEKQTVLCQFCRSEVDKKALVCPNCTRDLN